MSERRTIDRLDDPAVVDEWETVDDVVMGGRSSSSIEWCDAAADGEPSSGWLRFHGTVSLENNGGFCSVRQRECDRGQPGLRTLLMTCRGDGKTYKCTLRTADTPSSSSWRARFQTRPGEIEVVELPLDSFELWRRGTRLDAEATPDPARLRSVGVLISDKQAGDFELDLAELAGRFEGG